ncbi:MAG: hypothetical protein OEL81_06100 [Nitrosopumilus sp.]|nr:hypothetical protein [Nitrosopumilus sp.]
MATTSHACFDWQKKLRELELQAESRVWHSIAQTEFGKFISSSDVSYE